MSTVTKTAPTLLSEAPLSSRLNRRVDTLVQALSGFTDRRGRLWDPVLDTETPAAHYGHNSAALALLIRPVSGAGQWRDLSRRWMSLDSGEIGHEPFNRLLSLLMRERLRGEEASERPRLDEALRRCPIVRRYPSNNWTLLAGLCRLIEAPAERRGAELNALLALLERWTTPAGGFIDYPARPVVPRLGATPVAYHHKALLVATLAACYVRSPGLEAQIARMLDWSLLTWDGAGHVGGWGRSTHSLFGDACLLASLILLGVPSNAREQSPFGALVSGVLARWQDQERTDGLLALNPAGGAGESAGWDTYMFLSVYNAWAAAVLAWAMDRGQVGAAGAPGTPLPTCHEPVHRDDSAGLFRWVPTSDTAALLSTHGQAPQSFVRDQVELRYAGAVPFHLAMSGKVLCPPPGRIATAALTRSPALAGWSPVFEVDRTLYGLVDFQRVEIDEAEDRVTVRLWGNPVALARPVPRTLTQRCVAAVDWRLGGPVGRRQALRRPRLTALSACLVITLYRGRRAIAQALSMRHQGGRPVRYLNPCGHALVGDAMPGQRELTLNHPEGDQPRAVEALDAAALRSTPLPVSVPKAIGYCARPLVLCESTYSHRIYLDWDRYEPRSGLDAVADGGE